ncbi:hypothetical protein CAL29_24980 [Bordetella genomosp. 10]|uniref:histidine kinase n=1 Tax=Bordetella genomosp. 10 TaxID=1416804 RepID=A0A261S1H7_9BORD|nr:ATP-binding protein [Bordetella genomosp. 10]OZI31188.1 hypothetical protein CAL29_24980 [Bordetella genomosp. 10]
MSLDQVTRRRGRAQAGVLLLGLLMAAIFLADTLTRLEVAVAVFYVAVILLSLSLLPRRGVIAVALTCIGLTVVSLLMTPEGGTLRDVGLVNAAISIAAIGITAYLALKRAAAEEAVQEARAQLARLARIQSMGELTASIAHEINQPLAAIVTSGSACQRWLEHDPPNLERGLRALQRMIDDANRASEVVKRIRRLVRNAEPQMTAVDLADVAAESVDMARGEMQRRGVTLTERIQEDLPAVRADPVQIGQVIINLLLNAIEAMRDMPAGERRLTLWLSVVEPGQVQLAVADTGPGLGPQARERLFDAFWTTKPDGTGLGLTISRAIVESHGGRLWTEPGERGGAIFCFTLPVAGKDA